MAEALAYNINQAAEAVGLSRSTLYEAIRLGELEMGKCCGRSVIRAEVLRGWFNSKYRPARAA